MTLAIQELNPDFYLSIDYPQENGIPTSAAKAQLTKLVETLYADGFAAQIRPGDASHLLVFIKLLSSKCIDEIEKDLVKSFEFGVTAKDDVYSARLRVINKYLRTRKSIGGCGITPNAGEWKFVNDIVPITSAFDDSTLIEDLKSSFTESPVLTTNRIKNQYGIKIALYFEYFKFYMLWLVSLSVIGLVSYFKVKKTYSLAYTLVNLLWGTLFITFWNRKQSFLVNFWGVQNCHLVEEHYSELAELNSRHEPKNDPAPQESRRYVLFLKQLAFVPIALGFTAVLVSYQLSCFVIEIFLTDVYDGPGKSLLTLLPTILISVFVPILTIVYNLVIAQVIKWENHDNSYSRNNSVLIKTFVLNFLTSYVPLIITSFIYLPFAHLIQPHLGDIKSTISTYVTKDRFYYKYLIMLKKQEDFKMNQNRLNAQFFYFIVTNQVIQFILKYFLPLILAKLTDLVETKLLKKEKFEPKDEPTEAVWLHNIRSSLKRPVYDVNDDFRSLILQYGYLIMFGPVWPLAPLVCLIFNLIIFRVDQFKLANAKYFKPPLPSRSDSIHPWNKSLFFLTWVASVISPVVTAFYRHGTQPPKTLGQLALKNASVNVSSFLKLMLLMFTTEHGFLILSYTLYRLSDLFKSDIEWQNDFGSNDLKLRLEYYKDKEKPNIVMINDVGWEGFTVENTLGLAAPSDTDAAIEKIDTPKGGYSTSAQANITQAASRVEEKTKEIEQLPDTVPVPVPAVVDDKVEDISTEPIVIGSKEALDKIKDSTDEIISTKNSEGDLQYSTIDSNAHAEVTKVFPREDVSTSTSSNQAPSITSSSEVSRSDSMNSSSRDSRDKGKKRSGLKKIFKSKK
ncbi:uncharacterized protein SPAPADRAFT_133048 [Spathaspora passalidarum NRRL Y-27907]|uniref:Uncharacterized protein n=1 Tax=Spathaspora passalidarum (strain NRRL Y-27907 / 11-Y1) TaxID=619300 RepID=G3AG71_SPAPN|nr:uncharacterized protein SPAPADRAFT_133048 [Spathaspora passalidarum NRRL Y-27907]EGW35210.1 hypothetical protein SPAPADRAFT_133048 [Spathaspora passalidarum NRRL Y-27907]